VVVGLTEVHRRPHGETGARYWDWTSSIGLLGNRCWAANMPPVLRIHWPA